MSYEIDLDNCIDCRLCVPECPDGGIKTYEVEEFKFTYEILKDKCTECIEHNRESKCLAVCPVDCIILNKPEQDEVLWRKVEKNKDIR